MRIINLLSLIMIAGAIAWVLHFGVPAPWGTILAAVVILYAVFHPYLQRILARKKCFVHTHISILCYGVLSLIGVVMTLTEDKSQITVLYVLLSIGGVLGVVDWLLEGGYKKPIKQLWYEDLFILSWEAELIIIISIAYERMASRDSLSWVASCILFLFVLDIINQFVCLYNRHRC